MPNNTQLKGIGLEIDSVDHYAIKDDEVRLAEMDDLARGSLIVGDASGNPSALAAGTDNHVLTMDSNGDAGWEAAGGGTPEGTAVQSTTNSNEANTKYLRADGDGTCSWQTAADATKVPLAGGTMTGQLSLDTSATASTIPLSVKAAQNDRLAVWKNNDNGDGSWYATGGAANAIDLQWSSYSAAVIKFKNDGDVEIPTGNIVIGTSGKGIDFSSSGNESGMTSELLDDYEEGTYTVELLYNNTNACGFSTTAAGGTTGYYTKVGRMVTVATYIKQWTMTSGDGSAASVSLPFTVRDPRGQSPCSLCLDTGAFNHSNCRGQAETGGTRIDFYQNDSTTETTWASGGGNKYLAFCVVYQTD